MSPTVAQPGPQCPTPVAEDSAAHPASRIAAVALADLNFFRQAEAVLENITLEVDQGDFLALIGPNGGGKTTLLRLILGLLSPASGSIRVFGLPPAEAQGCMGYVPQFSTIRPDFPVSALQMTLMGAARPRSGPGKPNTRGGLFRGIGRLWSEKNTAHKQALELLELLGIGDRASSPVAALSGGQRQRLLVARALMGRDPAKPFLLLLDEPTANIDPEGRFCFYEFLDSLRGQCTMIVVSHDLGMVDPFFNKVAVVNRTLSLVSPDRCRERGLSGGAPDTTPKKLIIPLLGEHSADCPAARAYSRVFPSSPLPGTSAPKGMPHA